ncbi:MAG: PPC domain-containing protein [Capsulimonadales bacterium]|nr:PPC domain-containing protein [Capsulimonadales bacterium]
MKRFIVRLGTLFPILVWTATALAQTLRPTISTVTPTGGQRGTTVTFALRGINLGYGTAVLVDGPGLIVESVAPETPPAGSRNPDSKIDVRLRIAAETPPGRYPIRVLTPFGPSTTGYLCVGEWPQVAEKEPNNTPVESQPVSGTVTVEGRIDGNEDVDLFRITLKKGQSIVCSAEAGSIGSALTPVLTLRNARKAECAFGAALSRSDTLVSYTATEAGDYFLTLSDLRYQGGANHFYRLTIGDVPGVTGVFPLGGRAGTLVPLTLSGVNLPVSASRPISVPVEIPNEPLPLPDSGNRRFAVGTLPEVTENERNDTPGTATAVAVPSVVNGRIHLPYSTAPDVDCFRFSAMKGQVILLEVAASRLGTPLDPVLTVLDGTGKTLVENDDANGRDSALTFTAPETGEYTARLADVAGRAGDGFAYRLTIAPPTPDFTLSFSPDCLAVGPGDCIPLTVTAQRKHGFDGEIALRTDGLPNGLRLQGVHILKPGQNAVTLFALAATDGTPAAGRLRIVGTATVNGTTVERTAGSVEVNYLRENDQIKPSMKPVPLPVAAVTGPSDLVLVVPPERIVLKVGGTVALKVSVRRKDDFSAKIPVLVQGLPAGVSVSGNEIAEKATEATLTFKAEAGAAPGEISLIVVGRSQVDELRFTDHAALPISLMIEK